MKIDFKEIESGRSEYHFTTEPSTIDFNYPDLKFENKVIVDITAISSGDETVINGTASTSVTMQCDRCTKEFQFPLNLEFKLIIQRSDNHGDTDSGDEDFVILPKSEAAYDLSDYVRENLLIEIPRKILCDEDCKGLCPVCGINRNINNCKCKVSSDSGNWDDLKEILKSDKKEK
ncbi:MAG: DUF177 domain-containing protein [candidate division Zixibacteria bacterium]|nr:DUF177 domain-containing protein [candidate division Zixibacteria bacterium]